MSGAGASSAPAATAVAAPTPEPVAAASYYEPAPTQRPLPILGPITSGARTVVLDPPSDDEVMRALAKAQRVPGAVLQRWDGGRRPVRIVKEKVADYVDAPRHYPLVGMAQLHHAHFKCTIHCEDVYEVIHVDHNHLHMTGSGDGAVDGSDSHAEVE
ncbi:MAG TPA: hypothetical protein PKC18_11445 [Lacipirellulaceae bacterium]|nr:hypothetical protein [Lacipirellulaceae bacterium]